VSQLPEVPPIGATLPGFGFRSWLGIFGPAGLPAPAAARVADEIARAVREPATRDRLVDLGYDPAGGGPEALARLQVEELRSMAELIREAGITPQ
jgi:tripartite-type tricarboxylate transporter receptor subunit TctC